MSKCAPKSFKGLSQDLMYCVQPFVSETMRCVSNDFIEINDNSGQNVVPFYVERIERGRDLTTRETEKENVCERERERAYEKEV